MNARRVFLIENHDEALRVWRQAGVCGRTLVHVDAHHDMWWIKDPKKHPVTIANFISMALREGLVSRVIWVTPDASWETPRSMRPLVKMVRDLAKGFPHASSPRVRGDSIFFETPNTSLLVCKLDSLPSINKPALLDIDVDFMMIPRVSGEPIETHSPQPWIHPEKLLAKLGAVDADLVTIAYSVNGGYTPLRWKHLGDELSARLLGNPVPPPQLDYNTPYVNLAFPWFFYGDYPKATELFREVLRLDPENAWARLGLALIEVKRKEWRDAERLLREALDRNRNMTDAWRALADLCARDGRTQEAIAAYERSLLLALKGNGPLKAAIATPGVDGPAHDAEHSKVQAKLARLYEKLGDERSARRAIASYLMGVEGSRYRAWIYLRLARLYAKQRKALPCGVALGKAFAVAPIDAWRGGRALIQPKWSM